MYYILAPAQFKSGGPELAHQLCAQINGIKEGSAKMFYYDVSIKTAEGRPIDVESVPAYQEYHTEHVVEKSEVDQDGNVVVIPEVVTDAIPFFKHCKVVMWWMSVDNYLNVTEGRDLSALGEKVALHLVQSQYAKDYIDQHLPGCESMFVSDYINDQYGQFVLTAQYRKNMVLYNPYKGYDVLEPIQKTIDWIDWIPLINLTREQMIVMMESAKIYIDFGNHPGKDRIPREAAACGCCIVTNKQGSAAYAEDVPIDEKYKFEDPQKSVEEINALFHEICDDFETHMHDFDAYRIKIAKEKSMFKKDTQDFMNRIQG